MSVKIPSVPQDLIAYLRRKLLAWGRKNYRAFPWRNEANPFLSLVAEVLLQRTRAEQVVPVYFRFAEAFPDPASLARASTADVEKVIAPLGLRWRAKFLKELGSRVAGRADLPDHDLASLLNLPGIGPYAASAYLSLHAEKRAPILDSNIVRFYGRFFGFDAGPETRRESQLLDLADRITPPRAFRRFNYALIDFTGVICKPKPVHDRCPITARCSFCSEVGPK